MPRPSTLPSTVHYRPDDRGRRILNFAVALVGILVTLPLMAAVAVLVKLSSPGPVIFKQPRIGVDRRRRDIPGGADRRGEDRGGRVFQIYKFRTMRQAGDAAKQVWASRGDPRITPIGHFLRAHRMDELPQLFNVLKGDMNVVGPRPEQPKIFMELSDRFVDYRDRQKVLPGITGAAQVNLPYDQSVDDVRQKVVFDLYYVRTRSVWNDVKIMASTFGVLLGRKGAI